MSKPGKFTTILTAAIGALCVSGWYLFSAPTRSDANDGLTLLWVFFAGLVVWMALDHAKVIDGRTWFRRTSRDWGLDWWAK